MHTCPSCARHLLQSASTCPFCGAELSAALPGGLGRGGKMIMTAATMLTPAFLTACYGCPADKCGDDTGGGPDTSADMKRDMGHEIQPSFAAAWTDAGVRVSIENGTGTYAFGMVEGDGETGWAGDDCMNGDTAPNGQRVLVCHPMGPTGVFLAGGAAPGAIDPASQTALTAKQASDLTYMVQSNLTGQCWAWGKNPAYYADLGCTPL